TSAWPTPAARKAERSAGCAVSSTNSRSRSSAVPVRWLVPTTITPVAAERVPDGRGVMALPVLGEAILQSVERYLVLLARIEIAHRRDAARPLILAHNDDGRSIQPVGALHALADIAAIAEINREARPPEPLRELQGRDLVRGTHGNHGDRP